MGFPTAGLLANTIKFTVQFVTGLGMKDTAETAFLSSDEEAPKLIPDKAGQTYSQSLVKSSESLWEP